MLSLALAPEFAFRTGFVLAATAPVELSAAASAAEEERLERGVQQAATQLRVGWMVLVGVNAEYEYRSEDMGVCGKVQAVVSSLLDVAVHAPGDDEEEARITDVSSGEGAKPQVVRATVVLRARTHV